MRRELMKRAWSLKKKKPWLSFSKCLKWSWIYVGRVRGVEQEPVKSEEFVLTEDFMAFV